MAGFRNSGSIDVIYGDNVDFSGAAIPSPQVTTNGQLLIGSTSTPNIRVGTLTPGVGIAITNGAGSISIASNTSLSNYVVGPTGNYSTIQAAVNAAVASGTTVSITIYVQPGTYSENINFSGTTVIPNGLTLVGAVALGDQGQVEIIGTHTPPTTGTLVIRNFKLSHATAIFSSASAGSAHLTIIDALLNVTNGFTFNLANWTGIIEMFDINGGSATDGFLNNTGGASLFAFSAGIGSGTGQTMIISGTTIFDGVNIGCPANAVTGASITASDNNWSHNLTMSNNSTGAFESDFFNTGSSAAITQSSSGTIGLYDCVVNSSNNPAISGSGAGAIKIAGLEFVSNAVIAGTLTTTASGGFYPGGSVGTSGQVWTSNGAGAVPTFKDPTPETLFSYYLNGSQNNVTGDGTVYTLTGLTQITDVGGSFNGQTFTAPATGVYILGAQFYFSDLTAAFTFAQGRIVTSAGFGIISTHQPVWQAGGTYTILVNGPVTLTAGDTATFTINVSGSTKTIDVTGTALSSQLTYVYGYRIK